MYVANIPLAIQINQPTRCKNFSSLLLDVYVQSVEITNKMQLCNRMYYSNVY